MIIKTLSILGITIVCFSLFLFLAYLGIRLYEHFCDKNAIKLGKNYCEENGLDFKKVKLFPNHYGLYFKSDGKSFYASFGYLRGNTI